MNSEHRVSKKNLKAWQISAVRNMIVKYRRSVYEGLGKKKIKKQKNGKSVITVLTPPLGSVIARRRIKFAIEDLTSPETIIRNNDVVKWGKRSPHVFSIAVTYDCQCRCEHCSADTYRRKVQKEGGLLTFKQLKDAINQAVDLGATIVVLTGGEPLLRPEIFDLIDSINKNRCTPIMFTNGEFLNGDVVEKLEKSGLYGIFVSIDSAVSEKHDFFRNRNGLFRKATEGIRRTISADILTGISTVATKERVQNGDLEEVIELGKKLDVIEIVIFDITPAGKLENITDLLLGAEESKKIRELIDKYSKLDDYPNVFHESIFSYFAVPCVKGCPAGAVMLHMRANGDITACDGMPFSFGNIKRESLAKIWKRITHDEAFSKPFNGCRLANPNFRKKYLDLVV